MWIKLTLFAYRFLAVGRITMLSVGCYHLVAIGEQRALRHTVMQSSEKHSAGSS